jgi:hypothetical protein
MSVALVSDRSPDAESAPPLETLRQVEQRVLWLATSIVGHANRLRPRADGLKVGGHQASSASMVSIMTSLWFEQLNAADRVSVKTARLTRTARHRVPAGATRRVLSASPDRCDGQATKTSHLHPELQRLVGHHRRADTPALAATLTAVRAPPWVWTLVPAGETLAPVAWALTRMIEAIGEPLTFGITPAEMTSFLGRFGFSVVADNKEMARRHAVGDAGIAGTSYAMTAQLRWTPTG